MCLLRSPAHASHEAWKSGQNSGKRPSVASFPSAHQLWCVVVTGFLSQNTKQTCLQVSSMWHCQVPEISFSCGMDFLIQFIPGRDAWAVASPWQMGSCLSWGSSGWFLQVVWWGFFLFLFSLILSEATKACPACCLYVAGDCVCVRPPLLWYLGCSSARERLRSCQWQQTCFHVVILGDRELMFK